MKLFKSTSGPRGHLASRQPPLVEVAQLETLTPQLHKVVELAIFVAVEQTLRQESLLLAVVAVAAALDSLEMVEHQMVETEHHQRKTD